jgi:hypothetical protein
MTANRKLRRNLKSSRSPAKKGKSVTNPARGPAKVPFWKRLRFWVEIATIVGTVGTVLGLFVCRDGNHVDKSVVSHGQSGGVTAQTVIQNPTINYYFANQPPDEKERWRQHLMAKYPLGWAILAADGKTIYTPHGLSYERELVVRWGDERISELMPDRVRLQLPDIATKRGRIVLLVGCGTDVKRKVGAESKSVFSHTTMVLEVLKDEGDFVVVALGFREADESDLRPSSPKSQRVPTKATP